jgi:hypothetical protein
VRSLRKLTGASLSRVCRELPSRRRHEGSGTHCVGVEHAANPAPATRARVHAARGFTGSARVMRKC